MAIFGDLSDMPLADVLALMGKGFSRVSITKLGSDQDYELLFHDKCLFSIQIDSKPVEDVLGVSVAMSFLVQARKGEFRLDRKLDSPLATAFHYIIPVEQLLLSSMAANTEMQALKNHFPSEMTVFIFVGKHDCWMEDELQLFCDLAGPLLERGASGADIVAFTGLEQDRVLLNLYKLRAANLITPHRAPAPVLSKAVTVIPKRAIFTGKKASPPSDKLTPRIVFKETQDLMKASVGMPPANTNTVRTIGTAKPSAMAPSAPSVPAAPVPAVKPVTGGLSLPPKPVFTSPASEPVDTNSSAAPAQRTPSAPPRPITVTRQAPGVPTPAADLRGVRIQRPKVGFLTRMLEKLSSSLVKQ